MSRVCRSFACCSLASPSGSLVSALSAWAGPRLPIGSPGLAWCTLQVCAALVRPRVSPHAGLGRCSARGQRARGMARGGRAAGRGGGRAGLRALGLRALRWWLWCVDRGGAAPAPRPFSRGDRLKP